MRGGQELVDSEELLVDIEELMKKEKILLVEVEFDELDCLAQFNDPLIAFREELGDQLGGYDLSHLEEPVPVHRKGPAQVQEEPTVCEGLQLLGREAHPGLADVEVYCQGLAEGRMQLELVFRKVLQLALLEVEI